MIVAIYNDKYQYKVRNNYQDGKCHLIIYMHNDTMLCVATEIPDNTGMSVTNAAESIATQVYNEFVLKRNKNIKKFIWVEHYPKRGSKHHPLEESYDLVGFDWDIDSKAYSPKWKRIGDETEFDTFFNSTFSEKKTIKISEFRKRFFAGIISGQDGLKKSLEDHFDRILREMKNER